MGKAKKAVKSVTKAVTGTAKKAVSTVTGGENKESVSDNSAQLQQAQQQAQQAQMQANEAQRANQFASGDNMAKREAGASQSGTGTTMLTDADGVTLNQNQQKKKSLLGA